jgi:hypothetical protein
VLKQAIAGFNACVFAYGQTGAGKTFSMMGADFDVGIVPRMCKGLFEYIVEKTTEEVEFAVEVSFFEIYNEEVFDLLQHTGKPMKVRNHKVLGPYVEGLHHSAVDRFERIEELMDEGNANRTVAATNMNATSSRGHSIFTVDLKVRAKQKLDDGTYKAMGEKKSRISLVDLAGSERQARCAFCGRNLHSMIPLVPTLEASRRVTNGNPLGCPLFLPVHTVNFVQTLKAKTGASGAKLKEGANINKSLTTLGMVISALAEGPGKDGKKVHVPYRDSAYGALGGRVFTMDSAVLGIAELGCDYCVRCFGRVGITVALCSLP